MTDAFLQSERLYIRSLEPGDAPIVAACNNDPEVRATFFTHTPVSIHACEQRIRDYYKPGADYIPFAICLNDSGKAIGVTALHRVDLVSQAAVYSVCISDSEEWGKGYAGESLKLMLKYAFDILNLHRLQLHVWTENERAVKNYEKAGFVQEGTLREAMRHDNKWCDFYVMGLLSDEWRERNQS